MKIRKKILAYFIRKRPKKEEVDTSIREIFNAGRLAGYMTDCKVLFQNK